MHSRRLRVCGGTGLMGRQSTACQLKMGSDDDDDELKWGILPETVATTSATTIAWTTATTKAILQATACPLLSLLIQRKLCFCVSTFDGPLFQFSGTPKVDTETPMLAASVSLSAWWVVMVALWQEARLLRDSVRLIFLMNNWKIKNIQYVLGCHFHTSLWGQMVFKRRVVVRFINLTRVAPHLRIGVDPLGCRPFVAPENYYTIAPGNQAT